MRQEEKLSVLALKARRREALKEVYARGVRQLKKEDEYRLVTLTIWAERYKVNVGFILDVLTTYWKARRWQGRKGKFLGTRVATLVGKKSEEVLKEFIRQEFLTDEHKADDRERQRMAIVQQIKPRRIRRFLSGGSVRKFSTSYRKEIDRRKRVSRKIESVAKWPYRNNPWR